MQEFGKHVQMSWIIRVALINCFCGILALSSVARAQTFAEEMNQTSEPLGGYAGYSPNKILTSGDYTITTSHTASQFKMIVEGANPNEVVFVEPNVELDLSAEEIGSGDPHITIPPGVTLASDRGHNGSLGALLYSTTTYEDEEGNGSREDDHLFITGGPDVRVTGIRLRGPYREIGQQNFETLGVACGIRGVYGNLEVDNCELFNWNKWAIDLWRTDADHIHHNYIHHTRRNGYGYGIWVRRSVSGETPEPGDEIPPNESVIIEGNLLAHCRHEIAANGQVSGSYIARHNMVFRHEMSDMHMSDRHGGGAYTKIKNNIFASVSAADFSGGFNDPRFRPVVEIVYSNNWTDNINLSQAFPLHNTASQITVENNNSFAGAWRAYQPVAVLKSNAGCGSEPRTVIYDASDSFDPDGHAIDAYLWILEDGTERWSTNPILPRTYTEQGAYTIQVRARNEYGIVSEPRDISISIYENGGSMLSGLAAFWEMEESGDTRFNSFSNKHNWQAINTVGMLEEEIVGNNAYFNPADGGFLFLPEEEAAELQIGDDDIAYQFWVNVESLPSGGNQYAGILVGGGMSNSAEGLLLAATSGGDLFMRWSNGRGAKHFNPNLNLGLQTWRHVVVNIDRDGFMDFYQDGVWVDSIITPFKGQNIRREAAQFRIAGGYVSPFHGSLDQVGIWKRTLTPQEITWLYNDGAGVTYSAMANHVFATPDSTLVAHYKFNEEIGAVAYDSAGDNHGTIVGATFHTNQITDNSLLFDGDGDYVAIENLNYSQEGEISALTVTAWVKTSVSGSSVWTDNWSIVDFDASEYYNVYVRADNGRLGFSTASSTGSIDAYHAGTNIADGRWHHVAAVYNGQHKILYVDGREVGRRFFTGALGKGTTRYGFIGDGSEATSYNGSRNNLYFEGELGDVRIYHRALPMVEIEELMGNSMPANSISDFSGFQGQSGWKYGHFVSGVNFSTNGWEFDTALERWQGSETYQLLWGLGGHPGIAGGTSVRRWTSRVSGTLLLSGVLERISPGGDGTIGRIYHNGGSPIWTGMPTYGTSLAYEKTVENVSIGDTFDFEIHNNGTSTSDSTRFTAMISREEAVPTVPMPADSVVGFSGVQGQNGWEYGHLVNGVNFSTSGWVFDTASGLWRGPESYQQFWSTGGHPGSAGGTFVRRWTSPVSGTLYLSGVLEDLHSGGNGIIGTIYHNGFSIWSHTQADGTAPTSIDEVISNVSEGDTFDFEIHNNGNSSSDSTKFTVNITTDAPPQHVVPMPADSVVGFSGFQGQDGWEYGHLDNGANFTKDDWVFNTTSGLWQGPESYQQLWSIGGHPGGAGGTSVRRWTSPVSATLYLNGVLEDTNSGGNGIIGTIYHNGNSIWSHTQADGTAPTSIDEVISNVSEGDTFDFEIHNNGNSSSDSTKFTVNITTEAPPQHVVPMPADSVVGFSGFQGQDGWQYGHFDNGANFTKDGWVFDTTSGLWQGPESYQQLWSNGGHPGGAGGTSVRRWTSPVSGTLYLSGVLEDLHAGGNGIIGTIYHNGVSFWNYTQADGAAPTSIDEVITNVSAGDTFDFEIHNNGNSTSDSTRFTVNISSM